MSRKILHVCELDKFIPPFIDFVEENFGLDGHFFWLNGDDVRCSVKPGQAYYKVKKNKWAKFVGYIKLIQLLNGADKIILHGLFNPKITSILFLMPWLLKKCYWVIWGGDLYVYQRSKKNWKWKIKEIIRRPVIKNMGHMVSCVPGDVELARQWYGAQGEYIECLMYLSNVVDPNIIKTTDEDKVDHSGFNILVGNSADPSNNHIETLEKLLPYKDYEIKIIVPLSYGDWDHAQKVIVKGKKWFGDKFIPLTSFMAFEEYILFLNSIDIAIFNHGRQQAMGNTINLLGMGKTVYMRADVSHWRMLFDLGVSLNIISDFSLELSSTSETRKNSDIVREYFSSKKLVEQLDNIFRD